MDIKKEYQHLFPIVLDVEQGKKYLWCGCGKSKTPPLCDCCHGEECHTKSVEYVSDLNETVFFCNCKQTKSPPLCDGSHSKLLLEIVKKRQEEGEVE